jgi:hypothetical protein
VPPPPPHISASERARRVAEVGSRPGLPLEKLYPPGKVLIAKMVAK